MSLFVRNGLQLDIDNEKNGAVNAPKGNNCDNIANISDNNDNFDDNNEISGVNSDNIGVSIEVKWNISL